MPTYDYECQSCGHIFEHFQSMSDEPLKECPKCGEGVKRLIGGGMGIIFKGSGFYVTDNRSASKGTSSGNGGSDGPSESKSGDSQKSVSPSKESPSKESSSKESPSKSGGDGKKESA